MRLSLRTLSGAKSSSVVRAAVGLGVGAALGVEMALAEVLGAAAAVADAGGEDTADPADAAALAGEPAAAEALADRDVEACTAPVACPPPEPLCRNTSATTRATMATSTKDTSRTINRPLRLLPRWRDEASDIGMQVKWVKGRGHEAQDRSLRLRCQAGAPSAPAAARPAADAGA